MEKIKLGQLIAAVTKELRDAQQQTATDDKVMKFQECELEMAVGIEGGGKAGVNIWIFQLGGDVKKSDTHTVKVKFSALPSLPLVYLSEVQDSPGPKLGKR